MADTMLSLLDITREFVEVFHANCVIAKNLNHDYEKNFGAAVGFEGQKIGPTLQIREPIMTTSRSTWAMSAQDITETYKTLTIDQIRGIDLKFSDADMALTIDDFSKRYVDVPAKKLAAVVDAYAAQYMSDRIANNIAATALAVPTSIDTYLAAAEKIKGELVPMGMPLNAVIDPYSERKIVTGLAGQYNPQMIISDIFSKGQLAHAGGMDFYMSQILPSITCGTGDHGASDILVNAWSSTTPGTITYTADSTTTGTYKIGEAFTIAGVYACNFETKATMSNLRQFVVNADVLSSGGNGTITFDPPIYTTGAQQNVSAAPANGYHIHFGCLDGTTDVVTTAGSTYGQSLVFSKDSFAFASVPLRMPENVLGATVSSENLSFRFLRGYDLVNARYLSRIDIFFGMAELRRGWAAKITHV